MQQIVPRVAEPYRVYGMTSDIYDACASQADYTISEKARKDGTLEVMEDGEEIGTGTTMWHTEFQLPATFSTWSHVTMLHLWLITVRMRCLDKDDYQTWQKQLMDHFFYGAETKMEVTHDLHSGAIRQRYLKDLFLQWRGALLSYDYGLATDDAALAAAVWRNVFRAKEDIDVRQLAAVVSWMRLCLRQLGEMNDDEFLGRADLVFKNRAAWELLVVDQPVPELEAVLGKSKQ
ncbi:hypothetical protein GQ53DRAFT_669316 [Thozetella sp. PMI_491]|nr:hypothetical protein GQ53DRAFT_669316 [Thozetella sp. PMI_491]